MEIKVRGNMTIADIRQALFEHLHALEDQLSVRFSRGATLYINPTNEVGEDVVPRNETGRVVKTISSAGPYRSAADDYKL